MNRKQLAHTIHAQTGATVNRADAEHVVSEVFRQIARTLERGEEVVIHGFGRFYLKDRKERSGTAPDGTPWVKPAGKSLAFKPTPALKAQVES